MFNELYNYFLENFEGDTVGASDEYWLDDSGNTMYANGSISDMNHEAYVIQRCNAEILDYFHLNNGGDYDTVETHQDSILDMIVEDSGLEDDEEKWEKRQELENDPASAIIEYLTQKGVKDVADTVFIAYGSSRDAREYAIKNWGWSRVAGDSIETKELTRKTLEIIARGINNALDEEGKIYEYDETPDVLDLHEYSISTYTGKRFNITLRDMESGNVEGLERSDIEVAKSAATDQVKKMDMEQMPAYYRERGLMGDSYVVKYLEKL